MSKVLNQEAVNDRAKLLMHRIAARQIAFNPTLVNDARLKMKLTAKSAEYASEWQELLTLDVSALRRMLTTRTEKMDRLRLSSPFGLVLDLKDPSLRHKIWRLARKGVKKA